jgi:hypothetical protein
VTFLGQSEQQFKLVDQNKTSLFQGNEYHGPGRTNIQNAVRCTLLPRQSRFV